jgi:uncharacterized membrane protein (DUF4010 family)
LSRQLFASSFPNLEWPYLEALFRVGLALALGLFVGLERERRRKDAGARTFAFAAMLCCMGGLLGEGFAMLALALLGILVTFLNIEKLVREKDTELTTSAALLTVGFLGVLVGQGHTLTPAAVAVLSAALLTWKERLADFSLDLTDGEVRSAVLLAILSFVVYPALPDGSVGPGAIIHPKEAWMTVILIAGIGFVNYILLKAYGKRAFELTGFFGGLVNSTVTVTALAERVREGEGMGDAAYRGMLVATAAMLVRNAALLGILAPTALIFAAPAFALMLLGSFGLVALRRRPPETQPVEKDGLGLRSPFSFTSVVKFGLIFLALEIAGSLAQGWFGHYGVLVVSAVGGFISSASAVGSAASLAAQGTIAPEVAGIAAVFASLTSALVNLPIIARIAKQPRLTRQAAWSVGLIIILGAAGAALGDYFVLENPWVRLNVKQPQSMATTHAVNAQHE